MQRLNRGMMERYEIPAHIPGAVNAVQFGTGEKLLGVVDRLIDASAAQIGIACVSAGEPLPGEGKSPAALLREQDGMFTVFERGYRDDAPVNREIVVQSILRLAETDEELDALAAEPGLGLALIDGEGEETSLRQAARLLAARMEAGLGGLEVICLGDTPDAAEKVRDALPALAPEAGEDFPAWLASDCAFLPALAEGFAFRAEAREAAKLCTDMNYADGMIHLAEPCARLTVQAGEEFRRRWPLDDVPGVTFVEDVAPAMARKRRYFDGALFALAAPGWLLGCDTLAECMKREALRAFVGHACYDELLPADPAARGEAAPYVIEVFERLENPLNDCRILRAADHLLRRFARGPLPLMRAWAKENFEPPRRLSFALAATIMLYAGARPGESGRWEVARGKELQPLRDDPEALSVFDTLAHDMPPESLAYAALADRELWNGADLREIDGLEARVALDIANMQRDPRYLPEE